MAHCWSPSAPRWEGQTPHCKESWAANEGEDNKLLFFWLAKQEGTRKKTAIITIRYFMLVSLLIGLRSGAFFS